MRLPAPIIEGTLPAFYANERGIAEMVIPYSMNRAVSQSEVQGFKLKLKSVYGSTVIDIVSSNQWNVTDNTVTFNIDTKKSGYYVGNFYKVQIAYINNGEVGYYSTVGIIKLTSKPNIKIEGLSVATNNSHLTTYTGVYNQYQKDISEKVYSYRFLIKDENDIIIEDTGYLLHNRNNDSSQYESQDTFYFSKALEDNKKYKIQYLVKTNNNLEIGTPFYNIIIRKSVAPNFKVDIELKENNENGYIEIFLKRKEQENESNEIIKGSFLLTRSSEKSDFTEWEEIARFNLTSRRASLKTFKDFAVEQGIEYKYSIQQFNDQGLYSERNISKGICVDYEHSFLYDGERQLKIKFNPKINHFKTDVLEAKIDTIGSKYPFIFKNGNMAYKEFSIGGLISYLADEEGLFLNNNEKFQEIYRFDSTYLNKVQNIESDYYEQYYDSYYIKDEIKNSYTSWITHINKLNEKVNKKYKNEIRNQKNIINTTKTELNNWKFINPENLSDQKKKEREKEIQRLENEIIILERELTLIYKNYEESHINILNYKEVQNELEKYLKLNRLYENNDIQHQKKDFKNYKLASNSLEDYNFSLEREFKLEVLDWLNNGKPKLFKSPSEGIFLVRLMNTSFSPEEQINRLVHNFSSTAYEIGEATYKGLNEFGIIDLGYTKDKYYRMVTIPLSTTDYNYYFIHKHLYEEIDGVYYAYGNILPSSSIKYFKIENVQPGTVLGINGENIMIGSTGTYEVPIEVNSVYIPPGSKINGQITVGYMTEVVNSFDEIMRTETKDILGHQFFGLHDNIIKEINNIERTVSGFYDIKVYEREIRPAYHYRHYLEVKDVTSENFYNYYNKVGLILDENGDWIQSSNKYPIFPAASNNSGNVGDKDKAGYFQREELIFSIDIEKMEGINFGKIEEQEVITTELKEKYKDYLLYEYTIRPLDEHPDYGGNDVVNDMRYKGKIKIFLNYLSNNIEKNCAYKLKSLDKYYESITYDYINKNLDKQIANELMELKWQERASANYPYLSSIKNQFKINENIEKIDGISYYISPIYYYILPELNLIEKWNTEGIMGEDLVYYVDEQYSNKSEKYLPYKISVIFDNNEINVKETKYFSSGAVNTLKSLKVNAGAYVELYYQLQKIEYNNNTLIDFHAEDYEKTKLKLNEYDILLSRDYAIKMEAEGRQKEYISKLEEIYENYELIYQEYIKFLERFIKALEEE